MVRFQLYVFAKELYSTISVEMYPRCCVIIVFSHDTAADKALSISHVSMDSISAETHELQVG